jgi:cytoskeletal protein CcmA (bactofilin family)
MKKKILLICLAVLVFAVPAVAGESKYFSGESYFLAKDQTVDGDLFVFANSIRIEGKAMGEVFLMGSSVAVTGEVIGDAFVIGDSVNLSGHFASDTRVLGNTLDLTGTFDGEISAAGRHVDIAATAMGGVSAAGESISVLGTFADSVTLHGRKVSLLPGARFDKDVTVSAEEYSAADDVVVGGKLNTIIGKELAEKERKEGIGEVWVVLVFWLLTLCGIIVVGLVLQWAFPDFVARATTLVAGEPLHNLGWGILLLVLAPIVLFVLVVTLVGIPLALMVLVSLFVALYLGKLFVAAALGGVLISRFFKEQAPFWTRLVVGAVIVYLVLAVPFVGFLLAVIVYCLGVGALFNLFLSTRKTPQAAAAKRAATRKAPAKARR